jgi:hypothetical protein
MHTENADDNQVRWVYACCGASPRLRSRFWGSMLLLLGGLGVLSSVMPLQGIGKYVLPAFLALWGVFILWNVLRSR